jgi:hypothetical protein
MPDFNDSTKLGDGQEKVDRLTDLIAIFQRPELDFSNHLANGDDLLGDAFEYLMGHFASESGKSKGQFIHQQKSAVLLLLLLALMNMKHVVIPQFTIQPVVQAHSCFVSLLNLTVMIFLYMAKKKMLRQVFWHK